MIEMKQCPFCGSDKLKIESKNGKIHYYEKDGMKPWQRVVFSVRCNSCNARGGTSGVDLPSGIFTYEDLARKEETKNKAIALWNRRA